MMAPLDDKARAQGRFGTFAGVFTPSVLTILGVIMYLRTGWVVGQVGLGGALAIVALAHVISITTGLSIAAIATNRIVRTGGAYFMISRSLGGPAGAAIGIPLFLGQALSVTFYCIGFAETLQALIPGVDQQLIAALTAAVLTVISWKSAEAAIKTQYVVMAAIGLSLVSLFAGGGESYHEITWLAGSEGADFASVFAVFFPAVTGIMVGVGMSGDLKNPRRSIPLGTSLAILVGLLVYTAVPLWLALNADMEALRSDNEVLWRVARFPSFIYLGVWGATLSSALGSIMTAPRTLQALAMDGYAPAIFARGVGPTKEPRLGTIFTFGLAMVGILLGSLDAIASVLTMFFLVTYGMTNLVCGLERWAESPSFRPAFDTPAWVGFLGAVASFYVMSIIDLPAMLVALAVCGGIFAVAQRRSIDVPYGDARHAIWSAAARTALQQLRLTEYHPANWRPNLIILGGHPEHRSYLLELGSCAVQRKGVVTSFHLIEGQVLELAERREALMRDLDGRFSREYPNVFCRVDVVRNTYSGAVAAVQSYGVGDFEANSVLMGWPRDPTEAGPYVRMVRELAALNRSLMMVRFDRQRGFGGRRLIDIWWRGLAANGGMMLLLAHSIAHSDRWRGARVRVLTLAETPADRDAAEDKLRGILEEARIDAEPVVLLRGDRPVTDHMQQQSRATDLAMIGTRLPRTEAEAEQFLWFNHAMLAHLPTTILVHSARGFVGELVLFPE